MAQRANPKAKKKVVAKKLKGSVAKLPAKAKGTKKRRRIGDNSGKIPDEVYERHLKKIDQTAKAMATAKLEYDQKKGEHQAAYKAAKGDGCDTDAIKLARKLDAADHGVVQVTYANAARALDLMGSGLGAEQLNLFGSIVEPPPKVDIALQGQQAGKEGAPADANPHVPGTNEFQIWSENHTLGAQQATDSLRH